MALAASAAALVAAIRRRASLVEVSRLEVGALGLEEGLAVRLMKEGYSERERTRERKSGRN